MEKILVTGALGQLGTELVTALQQKYGFDHVIVTDIHPPADENFEGVFELLDVLDRKALPALHKKYKFTQVYHLAAVLSAKAEGSPALAWHINMDGLMNILEVAHEQKIQKIYWPSSIGVFGPDTPKDNTPQNTITNPNTIYGVTKVAGEKLCAYYHDKFGLDIRSLRYPGLIGYKALPGGGTTDYAIEIFHAALKEGRYVCPLSENATLPMMYMPDAVRATLELMDADRKRLTVKTSYNVAGVSFTPGILAESIRKKIPDFSIEYRPDFRDKIAASWPNSIDDSVARRDWNWKETYHIDDITTDMIRHLREMVKIP